MMRLLVFPALALAAVPAGHLSALAPGPETGLYLVLAPPWRDAEGLIASAGGQLVGPQTVSLGRLASAETPDFAERARALGLLVFDAEQVSGFCGTTA